MWLVLSIISTVLAESLNNAGEGYLQSIQTCYSKCSNNGRLNQACMSECQKKMVGEKSDLLSSAQSTKSTEVRQNNCGQICYQQCYVNNYMNQACYNQCMQQCQGIQKPLPIETSPIEEQAPQTGLEQTNCGQICYQKCYVNNYMNQACYNQCMQQCQGTDEWDLKEPAKVDLEQTNCGQICYQQCYVNNYMNQACYNQCMQQCQGEPLSKPVVELSALPVNCGQICFQNCYVNFQMVSGCYLSCVGTCTSTTTTLKASDIDRNCEMNCYKESCASGSYDSEKYAICVTKRCEESVETNKLPVPQNNCEWECYTSSWADSFFYLEPYEKCLAKACITDVEVKKEEENLSCPVSCSKSCSDKGRISPVCYDSCLNKCQSPTNPLLIRIVNLTKVNLDS